MGDRVVVAFLNAGRCGTGWLAARLRELHPELEVEHEPLGARYRPRHYFRCYDPPQLILELPEVRAHIERIEACARPYVETGWPQLSALPVLAARLGERLRIVHLTRHPVPTALAHAARRCYADSPRADAYTRLATLAPTDWNVFQPAYADCWELLTPYEKCLFWWTEVQMLGLELPGRLPDVPLLRLRAEDVLRGDGDALGQLLAFIGVPFDERWRRRARRRDDRWPREEAVDPLEIHRHPTTVQVARELGYDVGSLNIGQLEQHYLTNSRSPAL